MKKEYPKCVDCRYLSVYNKGQCWHPHRLTGLAQDLCAEYERVRWFGGCGKKAKYFEPKKVLPYREVKDETPIDAVPLNG